MQQRRPFESHRPRPRAGDIQPSASPDARDAAQRRREERLSRAAARRRRRFRRTLVVGTLLVAALVAGGVYAFAPRGKAPIAGGRKVATRTLDASRRNVAQRSAATTSETVAASSTPVRAKAPASRTVTRAKTASTASAGTSARAVTGSASASAISPGVDPASVRVAVWNGAHLLGVAHSVGDELAQDGYNVVAKTNADNSQHQVTLIVVRDKAAEAAAETVRHSLSFGTVEVTTRYDFTADVLVIIGTDWRNR